MTTPTDFEHDVLTLTTHRYPLSPYAHSITWLCSCGKIGGVYDGAQGVTEKRALAGHQKHKISAERREYRTWLEQKEREDHA